MAENDDHYIPDIPVFEYVKIERLWFNKFDHSVDTFCLRWLREDRDKMGNKKRVLSKDKIASFKVG